MKLFLLTLIAPILCHKATLWENNGYDHDIQGDYGKCFNVNGNAIGIQAPWDLEVQFYKGNACQNQWYSRSWGTVKFDKACNYYSVKFAQRHDDNIHGGKGKGSVGRYDYNGHN
ncbi:hypothetical protein CONCODRAFT_7053 [Conidiobolus coronatus NRRL 28638]|uniref:Uncharacterized protein n=1 Tax=Conidiobolus coronatus (strain ATCC 28846 / CBS 209.66 / NRRL 28638) TaxID=796925 RepID=A0A137P5Z8_CONC2|nr:hypothetical protein CONCODRAFT_7053 [Conidiobolus coronatus NRRL 28638]|eukprot:KXN70364.1 hypothetical protein CONCODRAFT_7053 [Conidiobolus coronatus NRRL 28638]